MKEKKTKKQIINNKNSLLVLKQVIKSGLQKTSENKNKNQTQQINSKECL